MLPGVGLSAGHSGKVTLSGAFMCSARDPLSWSVAVDSQAGGEGHVRRHVFPLGMQGVGWVGSGGTLLESWRMCQRCSQHFSPVGRAHLAGRPRDAAGADSYRWIV